MYKDLHKRLGLDNPEGDYPYIRIYPGDKSATLDGAFTAGDLRKIADEIDRQAKDSE